MGGHTLSLRGSEALPGESEMDDFDFDYENYEPYPPVTLDDLADADSERWDIEPWEDSDLPDSE
jgi:hypothetical protein